MSGCRRSALTPGPWACRFFILTAIAFFGCGDDDSSTNSTFTCENCEYWTQVSATRGSFPDYFPEGTDSLRTITFSSDRGNSINDENIWILVRGERNEDDEYHQITKSIDDEFDPAWSPDGTRIAYTRSSQDRFDIFVIDVTDFGNPGDPARVTSLTPISNDTLELPFRPTGSVWLDDDEILFSNGIDIFAVTIDPSNTPVSIDKVIDDPSDFVLSNVADFIESQPTGIRKGGSDQIYFISDGRVGLGAIEVSAVNSDEGGTPIAAEIFLEGVATGVNTPDVVGGRPLGPYVVGASITDPDAEETFCDTFMTEQVSVFDNDTADVNFEFTNSRGAIRLVADPPGSNLFFDAVKFSSISRDTTMLDCVFPNVDHIVKIESITIVRIDSITGEIIGLMDSACVSVEPRETVTVFLSVEDMNSVGQSDSLCNVFKTAPLAAGDRRKAAATQQDQMLWHYDGAEGSYGTLMRGFGRPSYPAVSPDGTRLAVVFEFQVLVIVSLEDDQVWRVRLPGEPGIKICTREVAFPSWSPDGNKIVVSLSPCTTSPSTDNNSTDYNIWEVDLTRSGVLDPS